MTTREQFSEVFEINRGQLKSFLVRLSACVADTEDIVQDTYLRGLERLESYRGDASLKTWIFGIATNLAKDNFRVRKRWRENVTDIGKAAALASPDFFGEAMQIVQSGIGAAFEIKEHIAFCFTCISKSLPLEQQICIFLKEVYEFKVAEIAIILDISVAMVKYYLNAARTKMQDIFDGRCALINKEGICHQCTELNGIFNPKHNHQEEVMKIEMARVAAEGDKDHLFDLRMKIMQAIDPFESPAAALQLHHLEFNRRTMDVLA
jgi:RNA polymerase sigma-70 factor, ECF subfamily